MCANVSYINAMQSNKNETKPYEIFCHRLCANIMANTFTFYDRLLWKSSNSKQFRVVKLKEGKSLENSPMTIEMNICEGKQWK